MRAVWEAAARAPVDVALIMSMRMARTKRVITEEQRGRLSTLHGEGNHWAFTSELASLEGGIRGGNFYYLLWTTLSRSRLPTDDELILEGCVVMIEMIRDSDGSMRCDGYNSLRIIRVGG